MSEKLVALAAVCNGPAWEQPVVVRRRKLLFGFIPYSVFECKIWVKDCGDNWRVMLSDEENEI